jgi:hypothetical protein
MSSTQNVIETDEPKRLSLWLDMARIGALASVFERA